ncbi:hypothetical protein B0H13DRAFT_1898981 [Mycena leptocephala]|nr:hypothetical protein B0H13DRAFT_1898981 [Mycena leptocephala]
MSRLSTYYELHLFGHGIIELFMIEACGSKPDDGVPLSAVPVFQLPSPGDWSWVAVQQFLGWHANGESTLCDAFMHQCAKEPMHSVYLSVNMSAGSTSKSPGRTQAQTHACPRIRIRAPTPQFSPNSTRVIATARCGRDRRASRFDFACRRQVMSIRSGSEHAREDVMEKVMIRGIRFCAHVLPVDGPLDKPESAAAIAGSANAGAGGWAGLPVERKQNPRAWKEKLSEILAQHHVGVVSEMADVNGQWVKGKFGSVKMSEVEIGSKEVTYSVDEHITWTTSRRCVGVQPETSRTRLQSRV